MAKFGLCQIQLWFRHNQTQCFRKISACLILAITLTSCTIWRPILPSSDEPPKIPQELLNYYDYPKEPLEATVVKEEDRKQYTFRQVELPLHLPPELWLKSPAEWKQEVIEIQPANEKGAHDLSLQYTNRLDIYLPKKPGKHPLILISPILGGNMIVDRFAIYFAKHGYVAVIVNRKKSFYDESLGETEQVEKYLRSSIIRLRQAVDWLSEQPEVDPDRIGAFAISYGAVLHSVLAAVEPRIKQHILSMPAAPLPDVIMECPDPGVRKLVKKVESLGWSREKIYNSLKQSIVTDPIKFAPYVPKKRIMIFAALFDRIVGTSRTFKLWNAMGRPKLKIIPLGHYGGLLVYPYLRYVTLRFFDSRL